MSVSEPQVWTLIGVVTVAFFCVLGLISTAFMHLVRTEIGGLRNEMLARFETVDLRLERLDRDVQAVAEQGHRRS